MTLFDIVFKGNDAVYELAKKAVEEAVAEHGTDGAIAFTDTAYGLPCCYGVTGKKVSTYGEMQEALEMIKGLMTREPRLQDAFMSGIATVLCAELIEALKYGNGSTPYEVPFCGHLGDAVIQGLEEPLSSGEISGIALLLGSAPAANAGVELVKSYRQQGILVTLAGGIADQWMQLGDESDTGVLLLGTELTSAVHAVSVAVRAALMFGKIQPGNGEDLMQYTKDHVPVFVNAFAPLDPVTVACGAGAIALGFPVITNEETFRVPKSLIVQKDLSKFSATSLEARGIRRVG